MPTSFLGDQKSPTYTHPYSLAWAAGRGATGSYGLAVSHIEASQRVYGQTKSTGAAAYYINPIGIESIILGAGELAKDTVLTVDALTAFSARVHLRKDGKSTPAVSFPLVQGMGFVSALYNGSYPVIQSGVYFRTVTRATANRREEAAKYKLCLEDGTTWFLYAYATRGDQLELQVVNNGCAEAKRPFWGGFRSQKIRAMAKGSSIKLPAYTQSPPSSRGRPPT